MYNKIYSKIFTLTINKYAFIHRQLNRMASRSKRRESTSRPDVQGKQCFLCGKGDQYMTRFANWAENEKAFVVKHLGTIPPAHAYICKKHHLEARRHKSTAEHIPKWGETIIHTPHHVHPQYVCTYPECTVTTNLIRASFDNSEAMLGVMPSTDSPNMLCRELYRFFHPSAVCTSCGATPKAGSSFTHHSPEPSIV